MRVNSARVGLFTVWCLLFATYLLMFLLVGRYKADVNPAQAIDAAWRTAYIMLPVLSAFASFWFVSQLGEHKDDSHTVIPGVKAYAAFTLTGLVHFIVLAYFYLYVVSRTFDFAPNPGESFVELVDKGLNMMVFISSLAVLPVGFLLRRPDLTELSGPAGSPDPVGKKGRKPAS